MITTLVLMTCLSTAPAATGEPPSDLPPAAQTHNRLGIAHIEAGAYAAGVDELERAYLQMPDPLQHRAGRSKVLGSMRSALNHLYQSTGDPAHLHRLHEHLLRHLEALLIALGDTATMDDAAGSLAALREVEETLAHRPAEAPAVASRTPPPRPVPVTSQRVTGTPPAGPDLVPERRVRIAGAILVGAGVAAVGVSLASLAATIDNRNKLQSLTRSLTGPGQAASPSLWQEGQRLHHRERDYQTVAIVTGAASVAMLATGIALRVLGKRRSPALARHHLTPARTADTWAIFLTGEF